MASGVLRLSDVIVPQVFTPMVLRMSVERTALITSGAAVKDPLLDQYLSGAGLTFNMPKLNPLDTSDVENVSSDDPTVYSTPDKPSEGTEIAIRLSRNNSWSQMDLVRSLLAVDPLQALAGEVAKYWASRRQKAMIAHIAGVFAADAAATDAYHTQGSMSVDLTAGGTAPFTDGVSNFNGHSFIDAYVTLGDNMGAIAMVAMHSIVYAGALKKGLIQFRNDADASLQIPTYMGKDVIMDDSMPMPSPGVFETWLLGAGCVLFGDGAAPVPNEVLRQPGAGNGGGQEIMWDRVEWAHHVPGTSYVGASSAAGGPSNDAGSGNLRSPSSWRQIAPFRKMIPLARIVTREFAPAA